VPQKKGEPKPASDGARYQALGNSMAVPVMRWIGERIENDRNGMVLGAVEPIRKGQQP
jgi:site-specific DNA-cytosine methylase